MAQTVKPVQLKRETAEAFDVYVGEAEAAMEKTLRGSAPFLWCDVASDTSCPVHEGQVVAKFWSDEGRCKVPSGLVHDWIGTALIPEVEIGDVLALVQNYENHSNIYQPDVISSKLISHRGNDFQIYLRLLKKKIISVVLDTEHAVHYRRLDRRRWLCRSYSTRYSARSRTFFSRASNENKRHSLFA